MTQQTDRELLKEIHRAWVMASDTGGVIHHLSGPMSRVAAALAQPEPKFAFTNLAARPLLEKVAHMADYIGQQTVAEIAAISSQAAAWLRENPPGQPVAIEPRGCPTPGACSCVEPAALAQPEPQPLTVQECNDMRKHRENYICESRDGKEINVSGYFTREDLIELANTQPTTH